MPTKNTGSVFQKENGYWGYRFGVKIDGKKIDRKCSFDEHGNKFRTKREAYLSQCTESKNHVKVITRHIWEPYMEQAEDIRHTLGMKNLYDQRKETIERIFGSAKEYHGFRYTNMIGKARMTMKAALTFTCMNLKKLAKIKGGNPSLSGCFRRFLWALKKMFEAQNKMAPAIAC